jgi:hypothetical protein
VPFKFKFENKPLLSGSADVSHQPSCSLRMRLFVHWSPPLPESPRLHSGGEPLPNSLESLDHGDTPSSLWTACFSFTDSAAMLLWSKIAQLSPIVTIVIIFSFK